MRVTFLGTGTSHGVPMIGCACAVCRSSDPRNHRLRPAILVEKDGTTLLVDAPPDFRTQALRAGLHQLDAVLLTHAHADHILGMDDLRAFTERANRAMPIWAAPPCLDAVRRIFAYACSETPTWVTLPRFELHPLTDSQPVRIGALEVWPLPLPHGTAQVTGFLFDGCVAYLTDCSDVPEEVAAQLRGVSLLILDGLRHRPHPTHLTIARAVELAGHIAARQTYLTHICHEVDHASTEATLPPSVRLAYDGLQLEI